MQALGSADHSAADQTSDRAGANLSSCCTRRIPWTRDNTFLVAHRLHSASSRIDSNSINRYEVASYSNAQLNLMARCRSTWLPNLQMAYRSKIGSLFKPDHSTLCCANTAHPSVPALSATLLSRQPSSGFLDPVRNSLQVTVRTVRRFTSNPFVRTEWTQPLPQRQFPTQLVSIMQAGSLLFWHAKPPGIRRRSGV